MIWAGQMPWREEAWAWVQERAAPLKVLERQDLSLDSEEVSTQVCLKLRVCQSVVAAAAAFLSCVHVQ